VRQPKKNAIAPLPLAVVSFAPCGARAGWADFATAPNRKHRDRLRSSEKINNLTQRRQGAKTRREQLLCLFCAFYTLRLCVKCFYSSRNYFTASCAMGYDLPPTTRAFVTRPRPCGRLEIVLDIGYWISYYTSKRWPPAGVWRLSDSPVCERTEGKAGVPGGCVALRWRGGNRAQASQRAAHAEDARFQFSRSPATH